MRPPDPLRPPARILLGPGPSAVDPRVLAASSHTLLGHLDPDFLAVMDDVAAMLREVFRTSNEMTLAVPGTGTAGMEAAVVNLVEPDDVVVVGVAGYFGARMAEMARRAGGKVVAVEAPWGEPVPSEAIGSALRDVPGAVKVVGIVHAETSTGVLQPLEEILALARDRGAFTLVDAVTSLGGVPLDVDALGIDVCYGGTQKCIGSPPGLAPLTASPRAVAAIAARRAPPASFYLDLKLLSAYWGRERTYHHTAPIQSMYALREALRLLLDEGLEARWDRHTRCHDQLRRGTEGLGLEFLVAPPHRLPVLNALRIPVGVDDRETRRRLLQEHHIEVGGGLGPLAGRIWRVGLMGYSAREENVARLLTALRIILGAPRMSKPPRRS
ncbi:MAG: pyridoxal-phosphate-dependent aminotransferase family protein [Candidatus Polarisedimenticolia bacterium]